MSDSALANATTETRPRPRWPRTLACALWVLARLAIIFIVLCLASMIAMSSGFRSHPDEDVHTDAFTYFQDQWSIPEPGLQGLEYSSMGWSRVYTGEIVYVIYGQASHFVQQHWESIRPIVILPYKLLSRCLDWILNQPHELAELPEAIGSENLYLVYRFFNVILLAFTLTLIFFAFQRCRWINPALLAITLICIPQVIYIYTYANSDAWGVTWSLLLFLQTATLIDRPPAQWRWYSIAAWMFSFLMLLWAKADFHLCFLLPAALLIVALIRWRRELPKRFALWLTLRWVIPVLIALFIAGLFDPAYTFGRSEWNQKLEDMRQERSQGPYKREGGWMENVYMIDKGWTYWKMVHRPNEDGDWLTRSLQSFYCRFAAWKEHPDPSIFARSSELALTGLALTLLAQLLFRKRASIYLYAALALAPCILAANLFGMMWYSLHIDYQPQGRYLFPSLAAIFLLFTGTTRAEWWPYRCLHYLIVIIAMILSLYCLHQYGLLDDTMRSGSVYSS